MTELPIFIDLEFQARKRNYDGVVRGQLCLLECSSLGEMFRWSLTDHKNSISYRIHPCAYSLSFPLISWLN